MAVRGSWQVQEAKSRFSALLEEARRDGPQAITRHGEPVAVLVSIEEYRRLARRPKKPLVEFLASVPLAELDLARDRSPLREPHDP